MRERFDNDFSPRRRRTRTVAALVTTALATAAGAAVVGAALAPAQAAEPVFEPWRDAADDHGVTMGFALSPGHLSNPGYRAIAEREFDLVVAENAMKWDATEPTRGTFSFGQADQVAAFAAANDADLYGHTLVWHSQLPGWAQNLTDPADLRAAMYDHIDAVAGRYTGQVVAWDVVNELWNDDGTRRQSVFQRVLGDGYVADALRRARQADPTAKLCLNDYNTDGINAKSTAMYDLVVSLRAQGVPIDCVGFQSHLIVGQVPSTYRQNLQRFSDLGVDVRVTELDLRTNVPASAATLAQQATDYRTVVEACLAVARCDGVTVWGVDDGHSWVPNVFGGQGAALPWDAQYQAKPAYTAVAQALGAAVEGSPSPSPTPSTSPSPDPSPDPTGEPGATSCAVTWGVSAWNTGYTGTVTIRNTGTTAWTSWTLRASLAPGQSLQQGWSAQWTQSGSVLTATNAAWNGSVPPGGSVQVGYNAGHAGDASAPTATSVNATICG
ncbi:endo-1,4-beta-xylanase (glycosyl hydrolase family 10) [Isoptericola jiangsuensis]|uniref:Beta-xylanase n=1 Tax=Isoptericola jiangsuensis TaxID=548579 RepID=A0A2A9EWV4_9MICO|nr:endo-1,4-beta-xylanase [Isoptericola jiangsuensis]PFG42659.1 endo-1,4-beta-xylanase (glycosyl hydrolase family 10) [Isoptericola jiangsuensis]